MPRKILVTGPAGVVDLVEVQADNEQELQEILRENPQLVPAEDLGLIGDLLVVGRETQVASGAIDLLCLSRSGELVIIEFKTGPQNSDFRHALAQVIDYGSDLWKLEDWETFDEGVVHRYLKSQYVDPRFKACADLRGAATVGWDLSAAEWDALSTRLDQVIKEGDFHFVVAAQRFIDSIQTSVRYLNATAQAGRYFLMEVIRLDGGGQTAYAAQIVHKPERRSGSSSPTSKTDEDEFLGRLTDPQHCEAMSELFASAQALGLTMEWGSKGASIRLKSPDRPEPISIGWAFAEGDGWTWAKHVTLGVDPNTLQNHPSVEPAILDYCQKVKSVEGAKSAGGKSNAAIFEPRVFVNVRDELIGLLGELASAASR
ncbi:MAG: endonuclease NucS [Actinobacteria bacterium]|nr:endonuclease NucS [Actinomycetota bacterium]